MNLMIGKQILLLQSNILTLKIEKDLVQLPTDKSFKITFIAMQ
jgi:hypothetical protein